MTRVRKACFIVFEGPGKYRLLGHTAANLFAFERVAANGQKLVVELNMSDEALAFATPKGKVVMNSYFTLNGHLNPWQAVVWIVGK